MRVPNRSRLDLSAFYKAVGGDLTDVLERLEDIETVEMFVLEFADDPSYTMLLQSLNDNDIETAFRGAHTLKGISSSLGFKRLYDCSANLCDKLRKGTVPSAVEISQVKAEYNCVISAIKNCKKGHKSIKF